LKIEEKNKEIQVIGQNIESDGLLKANNEKDLTNIKKEIYSVNMVS
jgi:hypothetical protein